MFVIYVSSEDDVDGRGNVYGYFRGKCYMKDGMYFPVADEKITEDTKRYKSEKRADMGAKALIEKCPYVESYKVEEI